RQVAQRLDAEAREGPAHGVGDPSGHGHRVVGRARPGVAGAGAMNFLNPLFLFGLAAAAVPGLIHLFPPRKAREVRFPSLDFLSEVNQSEIRRLRLKQWLLLLLRTLAVALLALAMARPSLRGSASGGSAASTLVALVDVSGSMGAPDAEGRP